MTPTELLFPACTPGKCPIKDCKDKRDPHYHILPQQQELLESREKFIALVGGYGSAKTLPSCIMGHILSVSIPGNMGIVMRRSLPKLHDSTERIYLEVLERSGVTYQTREMRDGWPHRIIYPNGSEVVFRETTDIGRFLGPEYGWAFLDEAQEEPEKTFKDVSGRLRLPRAADYLKFILATNPPSSQHWIAKTFPKPGAWTREVRLNDGEIISTSYRLIRSSTYENPFVNREYVAQLLLNHTPAEAKRIIDGMYGFSTDGKPVYATFDFLKHVGDPKLFPTTVYRVWDWGYHCPACSWHQIFRCKSGKFHMVQHEELIHQNIESEDFAKLVIAHHNERFSEIPRSLVMDGADAAGAAINEKGPGPIIRLSRPVSDGGLNLRFKYQKFADIDPGLDLVRKLLNTKCKCGSYLFHIHRRCSQTIEALAGGYHYPPDKIGKDGKKPVKDGYYDNIADTVRYAAMLFYRPLEMGAFDPPDESLPTGSVIRDPYDNPFG